MDQSGNVGKGGAIANIIITTRCNLNCRYCFARDTLKGIPSEECDIGLRRFEEALDFLERSDIEEVRLLGGEPTLHPEFGELIKRAVERGLRVVIFTNGLLSGPSLGAIEPTPPKSVITLLNATMFPSLSSFHQKRFLKTLSRLESRVTLGFTIDRPAFQCDFLLELIDRYHLSRNIRLGLANPCLGGDNEYLHPKQYPDVGLRVSAFSRDADRMGVSLGFDCGFVPCMFPGDTIELFRTGGAEIGMKCAPILDILPDGRIISCFPLACMGDDVLSGQKNVSEIKEHFSAKLSPYRQVGVYRSCFSCVNKKSGRCTGGCLAAALQRFRKGGSRVFDIQAYL